MLDLAQRRRVISFSLDGLDRHIAPSSHRSCHTPGGLAMAWSEALECAQLAAAFLPASLLAGTSSFVNANDNRLGCGGFRKSRKRACGAESGSKLRALQSFAPCAV